MEVTLEITDFCPHSCTYCSTNAGPIRKNILSVDEIKRFLAINSTMRNRTIDRINISGGEPLSHPQFYYILNLCYRYTDNVWVYTNAIKQIMYNTDVVKEIKTEANVCLTPGKEVYIPKNADKVHLLQLVKQGRAKNIEPANISASANIPKNDCSCDSCDHTVLQADRKIVGPPCEKKYE